MKPLKLTVEPIPVTSAGKSLSRLLPKHRWDNIRKAVYVRHNHKCAVCGVDPKYAPKLTDPTLLEKYGERIKEIQGKKPWIRRPRRVRLECHEVWEYDDDAYVQRLSALCSRCHLVKHWHTIRTHRLSSDGPLIKGGQWCQGAGSGEQQHALFKAYNPHHDGLVRPLHVG